MGTAFYDGNALFGPAPQVRMTPNPTASQEASFFGSAGSVASFGGTRGRIFEVTGILVSDVAGYDFSELQALCAQIESYADGVGRVFTDTLGRSWPYVVLRQFMPGKHCWATLEDGLHAALPFKAIFQGML